MHPEPPPSPPAPSPTAPPEGGVRAARQDETAAGERDARAAHLLALARRVADESRPQAQLATSLGLDDALERGFGLDSLARVELISRIDQEFGVALGEAALTDAETPRDLLRLIDRAVEAGERPTTRLAGASTTPATAREAEAAADTPSDTSSDRSAAPRAPSAPPHEPGAGPGPPPESTMPPTSLQTLVDVLAWHVERHPKRVLFTLLGDGDAATGLSYADLQAESRALAAGLRALGLAQGDAVAIMLPTGREFFVSFFGALLAGMVPVPLYPPARPSQLEDHLRRIAGILRNAGARALLTVERAKPLARLLRAQAETLQTVTTVDDVRRADDGVRPDIGASDTAFLQYTSGSTGDPKGVVLTHAGLLANLRAMQRASQVNSDDTFVSWLPLYHDMGLIGACLGALLMGFHTVLMSPVAFLARPARWLQAVQRYRGTVSAAPNFAYELCLAKLSDADLDGLDLSTWRLAFNGAEPVSPDTLDRFAERFARCGFDRRVLTPVYGLAENAVGLAFPPMGRGPLIDRVDRAVLVRDGLAAPARPDDAHPLRVVSCGRVLPGHELRVVEAGGRELPEREQGRVQFRGPSSTPGYLHNPQANARLFDGEWLNTGDLGYMASGELFLTGREKDIIIRGGFNIHPQELEGAVAAVAGIRKGGVAVFAASDPRSGTERLVVLAETSVTGVSERQRLVQAITELSTTLLGAPADDVVLAPPRSVLKTSSGKTRRAACRELYESGRLGATQRAPWRQWLALAGSASGALARRSLRGAGRWAWGAWAWAVFCSLGALAWCSLMLLPGLRLRRRVAWSLAHAAIRLIGLPVRVDGLRQLSSVRPLVVVANHASYADAILLGAVLPPEFAFAAKRELSDAPFIGVGLRRLGTVFVEREHAAQGVEDTRALLSRVQAGESVVFFPEGTFGRASGLRDFKLGAFMVAAQAGVPLVPVTMNGTRSLLRSDTWLPRRCNLGITVGTALTPAGPGWDSAIALRDAARRAIAATLAEPNQAP